MGFDITVTNGRLRSTEAPAVFRELLEFAVQMELDAVPINWIASGEIPDYHGLSQTFCKQQELAHPISRSVVRSTYVHSHKLHWFEINREHVQGLILCHYYENWILTWNVSRGGLLAAYSLLSILASPAFGRTSAVSPVVLLSSLNAFMTSKPIEVHGQFAEDLIHVHCPWRRSDAAAACDALGILARHCDDFTVQDDLGVWPAKDFSKWMNLAAKYAKELGTAPVHPDPGDQLRSDDR